MKMSYVSFSFVVAELQLHLSLQLHRTLQVIPSVSS